MGIKKIGPLFLVAILAVTGFALHKAFFYYFVPKVFERDFVYSLMQLYLGFFAFSFVLIFILGEIKKKNIDNVGYTFLLLTCFKMMAAYVFLRPILQTSLPKTPTEKINFFIIFIYFLTIETIVTIRILNNKQ